MLFILVFPPTCQVRAPLWLVQLLLSPPCRASFDLDVPAEATDPDQSGRSQLGVDHAMPYMPTTRTLLNSHAYSNNLQSYIGAR